jgi:hypothetical protein
MIQDYKTAKDRLNKVDYSEDFRLADSDDFFGFQAEDEDGLTLAQVIVTLTIGVPVLFGIVYLFLSLTPNI